MKTIKFIGQYIRCLYISVVNSIMGDKTSVILYNGRPATIQQINETDFFIDAGKDFFLADEIEVL